MFINEAALALRRDLKDVTKQLEEERKILSKENDLNALRRRVSQSESTVYKDKVDELEKQIEEMNRRLSEMPYNKYDINCVSEISDVLDRLDDGTREVLLTRLLNRLAHLFDLHFKNSGILEKSVDINLDYIKCHLADKNNNEVSSIQIVIYRLDNRMSNLKMSVNLVYGDGTIKTNEFADLSYWEKSDEELTLNNTENNSKILKDISSWYWMIEFFVVQI